MASTSLVRHGLLLTFLLMAAILLNPNISLANETEQQEASKLPVLMAALFQNPTNLELNFEIMQAQMAEGNLEAAEATLERVLILDPDSRLARFLMAEIRIQLGKLSSARVLLLELLDDPDTNEDTRNRAEALIAQIDDASATIKHSGGYSFYLVKFRFRCTLSRTGKRQRRVM